MESGMSKIDEVMEIKALRRVISAYLNYTAAAEEDIKRWDRSFTKLSSSHKALLRHLPKKHEELRRCVCRFSWLASCHPFFPLSCDLLPFSLSVLFRV
jgi:hypothetical protein